MPKAKGKPSVLMQAEALVNGDRNEAYGDPYDNHQHIADIFNAWTGMDLLASDIARVQLATKMAREQNPNVRSDTYVDISGYSHVLHRCVEGERRNGIEREET